MAIRLSAVLRVCREILTLILQALLITWGACAPVVGIVRDGLGPDTMESGWMKGAFKFLVL